MIHPSTRLAPVGAEIGFGVFASAFIPAGTIVYVCDELEIRIAPDDPMVHQPHWRPILDHFSFTNALGERIISWDHGKHVNHHCRPNTLSTGYGIEIAVRDIHEGEEVTDDYGMFFDPDQPALTCLCGDGACRGLIDFGSFDDQVVGWNRLVRPMLAKLQVVDQPLWPFMSREIQAELLRDLDRQRFASVRRMKPCLQEKAGSLSA